MMTCDRITLWRETSRGTFTKTYVSGVRVEENEVQSDLGTVSPLPAWKIRVFLFTDKHVRLGDFIAKGIHDSELPSEHAHRIVSIKRYSMRHKTHHVEVEG